MSKGIAIFSLIISILCIVIASAAFIGIICGIVGVISFTVTEIIYLICILILDISFAIEHFTDWLIYRNSIKKTSV